MAAPQSSGFSPDSPQQASYQVMAEELFPLQEVTPPSKGQSLLTLSELTEYRPKTDTQTPIERESFHSLGN